MVPLRLRRLQIHKYRNVAGGTDLVFQDGMNVLLGPNGSGKTTLLRLISMIARDEFSQLAEEEFDFEYEFEVAHQRFFVRFSNEESPRELPSKRATSERTVPPLWSFLTSLLAPGGHRALLLNGAPLGVVGPEQVARPVRDPFRDQGPWEQTLGLLIAINQRAVGGEPAVVEVAPDFEAFLHTLRYRVGGHAGRFDEGLGIFASIVGTAGALDMPDRTFPRFAANEAGAIGHFVPNEVVNAVDKLLPRPTGTDITLSDSALPFLNRVTILFGAKEARMVLRFRDKDEDGIENFDNFEFFFTLDDGTTVRHDFLSWGQKRLLSFYYYVGANPHILVVDELVNGLHHEWITACLDEMADRQCFLTSQNPLLLDHLTFESAEDVRDTFIQCRREKAEPRARLKWQHVEQGDAESFFRAYKVGIQHVGELLRIKGLW